MMQVERTYAMHTNDTVVVLTPREREVMVHVAAGISSDAMVELLGVQKGTIGTYVSRLCEICGAHNRYQLASWLLLTGMVTWQEVWDLWQMHAPELAAWRNRTGEDNDTPTI